ncbi:hypothetical protein [Streptomyces sp. 5-6(2022)]|uniref:hypothetical protein n=1 Tax=Streptomyces sp. 5-6(2022) TaxID=2936510 RepID=UPI0023B975D1|nr:hypothetical protein [Streptomyces sp. 5-6(2022)]
MLDGEAGGFNADPNQTVADYLTTWLEAKALTLKQTTLVRYRDYVTHDPIPALGTLRLDDLGYRHIAGFARTQLATGRGRVTPTAASPHNWAAISPRIAAALQHQAPPGPATPHPDDPFSGLVFTRPNGQPLRPQAATTPRPPASATRKRPPSHL